MKYLIKIQSHSYFLIFAALIFSTCNIPAQKSHNVITKNYKDSVISTISMELQNRYVFPDVAKKISSYLNSQNLDQNLYDKFNTIEQFSNALSNSIYKISKDKHITVNVKKKNINNQSEDQQNWISSRMETRAMFKRYNANFKTVKKLENNIGYLELTGFYPLDFGRKYADLAMTALESSDAIIIDLRKNSGGRGDMVDYLLSYFFEEQIITGKSRKRSGDSFVERTNKTPKRTYGRILSEVPLFVLTSRTTFSAAEGFSYPLQAYNRATFIGETTKGGANAGDLISINDELEIFIPDVASLPHPETNAIWEGIGIIPDIEVKSELALEIALREAKIAAENFKSQQDKIAYQSLVFLDSLVNNYDGKNEQRIVNAYLECKKNHIIFEEWELNSFGYQLLHEKKLNTSLAIFKTNTVLYPNSANTFDSYAEALILNNNLREAVLKYETAVKLAKLNENQNLQMFVDNLEKAKNQMQQEKK